MRALPILCNSASSDDLVHYFTTGSRYADGASIQNERSLFMSQNCPNRPRPLQLNLVKLISAMRHRLQAILDQIIVLNPTIYISQATWNVSGELMARHGIFTAMRPRKGHTSQGRS